MSRLLHFFILIFLFLNIQDGHSQQRFPKPEFESGYTQPDPTTPEPRSVSMEYMDILVLVVVLILAGYFVFKKRSRKGILWLSVFALFYFGFYRNGCICAIGAVQNVALSIFDKNYSISLVALAFFLIPLIIALFYGRLFCAAACPLGAIQDVVAIKPIPVPIWLQRVLGLFPYIYLGFAILYAATGSDFIICRYDPFIGIFRMGAEFHMIILGISFLLIGLFVARPYCRFVCPYGALLHISSVFSQKHLSITPSRCIQCKLCANSCPFDAIEYPNEDKASSVTEKDKKRFRLYIFLIPIIIFLGGLTVSELNTFFSRLHPDVELARLLVMHPELRNNEEDVDIQTFMSSGKSLDTLVEEAQIIQDKFYTGGWILGGFIGLVVGISLLNLVTYRKRTDFEPHKGRCYSCGRCMKYCPIVE